VILYRKLLKEQIEIVRAGGEPLGIIRDPERNQMIELATSTGPVPDQAGRHGRIYSGARD
jgi:hypothetical protein